jgi:hypothetical protein
MLSSVTGSRSWWKGFALVALGPTFGGCTLTEVTTAAAEDLVVVEALLQRREAGDPTPSRIQVFLHRTVQGEDGANAPVDGAEVRVEREDGTVIALLPAEVGRCVASTPAQGTGSCYLSTDGDARAIEPGEHLELTVHTARGERMEAISVVPGGYALATAENGGVCRVEANDPLEVVWGPSEGAWSYLNELEITGLPDALPDLGDVDVPDPLVLLGVSVSATDTTIVVPNEFGLFDRFDLEQPLAVALQEGLPAGSRATVSITAVDRNYVNWIRGGSFNPSGQVRTPSVRGDGTGYFGTGVVRTFQIRTDGDEELCPRFGEVDAAG